MKFHFGSHQHHGGGAVEVEGAAARGRDPRCPAEELYGSAEHAPRRGNEDEVREEAVGGESPSEAPMKMTGMAFFHASSVASRHFDGPRSPGGNACGGGGSPASPKAGGGAEGSPAEEGSPPSKRALHLDHQDVDCPASHPDPHSRPRSRQFFRLGRHRSKGVDGRRPGHPKDIDALTDRTAPCGVLSSSDSSDDELGGSERTLRRARDGASAARRPGTGDDGHDGLRGSERFARARRPRRRGIAALRKPRLRRSSSAPLPSAKAAPTAAGTAPVDAAGEATAAPPPGVEGAAPPAAEAATVHAVESEGSFGPMDCSTPEDRIPEDHDSKDAAPGPCSQKPSQTPSLPELTVQARTRRTVSFAFVQIREYSTILGDHPCCPSGPPLALGWDLERETSAELDAYEREREPMRAKSRDQIRLGGEERRGILRSLVVAVPGALAPASPGGDVERGEDDGGACHHRHNGAEKHVAALYSARELCRAERRLTRDRAALNARAHQRRVNRGFFRPLTPAEEREGGVVVAAAAAAVKEEKEEEHGAPGGKKEGAGTSPCGAKATDEQAADSMDVSPVKPVTVSGQSDAVARQRKKERTILKLF